MVVAQCASPIKGEVIRITKLDACGVPVTGVAGGQVVMDAFTELQVSPNYEEGQRYLLKKANGQPCVNQKDAGFLNWLEITTTLCTLDPVALTLISGDRLISNGVTGIGAAFGEGLLSQHYSMEVWQPVAGSSACAGGTQQYFYWAFPNIFDFQIQDFTFQNDTFTFGWKGTTISASTSWVLGDPWLPGTGAFLADEHFGFALTTVAPPAAACGSTIL